MSTPENKVANKIEGNTATISGKVTQVQEYNGKIYTQFMCPAVDEWSSPQVVQVRSDHRFASVNDQTTCKVTIGGWNRSFMRKDGQQGHQNTIVLDLV